MNATAKLGPHHALTGRCLQDDADRLLDVTFTPGHGDAPSRIELQGSGQALAQEFSITDVLVHGTLLATFP